MTTEIRADIVGNVLKVVVSVGDTVTAADDVVILESMKMEIPVRPESSGVIAEILVGEGDVVQEGDVIAVVE